MSQTTTVADYAPHMPDAVKRAAARADELAREAGIANMPPLPASEPGPNAGAGAPAAPSTPPEAPQGELFTPEEAPPQPAPPPPEPSVDWEQRYNTIQGKYNTEVAELRGQLRAMQETIANLQAPRPPNNYTELPPAPVSTVLPSREVPQEDLDAYGPDLVHKVRGWSRIEMEPRLSVLENRLMQLEAGNQQLTTMSAVQRVDMALDRAFPEWRRLNNDRDFITWINQVDPFSGRTRKQLADEAYASGDAARTLAFFQAYNAEHTAVRQAPGIQPGQTGANPPAERLPLVDLAVPGRGQTATPPAPGADQRRIWTNAGIAKHFRDTQRGYWAGREAEAARIEADFSAAGREGRVRQ